MPHLRGEAPSRAFAVLPEFDDLEGGAVNNSARQVLADVRTMANDLVWFQYGKGDGPAAHAYASATSTTVSGADVTVAYHAGRRIKAVGPSTGTIYGSIASSSFSTNTTVNYTWDSGSLANEALTIYLSQVPVTGKPIPATAISGLATTLPTRQVLTSGSSATYTTPAGCRQLRIRMVGGGGGGQGVSASTLGGNGSAGGDTSFNSIVAKGGGGGTTSGASAGGSGGTGSASVRIAGGSGSGGSVYAPPNPSETQLSGNIGAASPFGGAGAGQVNTGGQNASANSGSGGAGGSYADTGGGPGYQTLGGSGAAGEYVELIMNTPSSTYTYTVGSGGNGSAGTDAGGNGGSGIIIIDEFY